MESRHPCASCSVAMKSGCRAHPEPSRVGNMSGLSCPVYLPCLSCSTCLSGQTSHASGHRLDSPRGNNNSPNGTAYIKDIARPVTGAANPNHAVPKYTYKRSIPEDHIHMQEIWTMHGFGSWFLKKTFFRSQCVYHVTEQPSYRNILHSTAHSTL